MGGGNSLSDPTERTKRPSSALRPTIIVNAAHGRGLTGVGVERVRMCVLICVLFGFYLATSTLAPEIRTTVTAVIRALTGQG